MLMNRSCDGGASPVQSSALLPVKRWPECESDDAGDFVGLRSAGTTNSGTSVQGRATALTTAVSSIASLPMIGARAAT
jgi:hypothetical protein